MSRPRNPAPGLWCHKSGQAVVSVRLSGGKRKDIYCGAHGTPESRAEHRRILALLDANGGVLPSKSDDLTINEALVRFTLWADGYYVDPDGNPSGGLYQIKISLGYLRRLFGPTLLADFGPPELKAVREAMIAKKLVRKQINGHCGKIRQFFRWCVEEQLVPPAVLETLKAVKPLAPGRSGAKEGTPREPADPAAVVAALPFMNPAFQAIVLLLRLSGARPSEILLMKPEQIDRTGDNWKYNPLRHKTAWKGKSRTIFFGMEAQAVLAPWLLEGCQPDDYVFSPAKSHALLMALRSAERKTPRWPSHMAANERKRNEAKLAAKRKRPQSVYNHKLLFSAVRKACIRAGVKHFSPYQLRHLRAAEINEQYGLDHVRATLGQHSLTMAYHYARGADERLASAVAATATSKCG